MASFQSDDAELILSDLHHRISGVSATVRALVPRTIGRYKTALLFQQPIADLPRISLINAFRMLRKKPIDRPFRIWHVRRNNEMLWGIIARDVFKLPVKLVFTSAAIRRHSWYPRQLIKRMDTIIATSSKSAEFVAPVASIVPHGVDIDRYSHPGSAKDLLKGASIARSARVCGIVGRVRPEKGTDLFVEAMVQVMSKHPDVVALIVGKTTAKFQTFKSDLERSINAVGLSSRFIWLDEVPYERMPDVYGLMDIVCSPALYEGFGVVPIEAMVSGTAVVASRTGAYEDMVEPGINGFLTDCGDVDGLIVGLGDLLSDTDFLNRCKLAGQKKVRSGFSLESEFEGISAVYEDLWQQNPN